MNKNHPAILATIKNNPDAVEDYRGGDDGTLNFLVGQVMHRIGGYDPGNVQRAIERKLEEA